MDLDVILKPCPFCGNTAAMYYESNGCLYVECNCCGARIDPMITEDGAATAWNRRYRTPG